MINLKLEDIKLIYKSADNNTKGYIIEFNDGKKIHLTKRRTIIALLILIKYGVGSESDLAKGNTTIPKIKEILGNKIPENLIADFYGDANKPYSELWNEEGFTFIDNLKGNRIGLSQGYLLHSKDHHLLFTVSRKAYRIAPINTNKDVIRDKQNQLCNICKSKLLQKNKITTTTFCKDRKREVFDHRMPVEKGGTSDLNNFQALCFYCNKSKWQICNICHLENCDENCALRDPENNYIISPTQENISDILKI